MKKALSVLWPMGCLPVSLICSVAVVALVVVAGGCHTDDGGCSVKDSIRLEMPVKKAVNYEWNNEGAATVVTDHKHDCEYVVINNVVFCWRGTNLLYTSKE